MPPRFSFSLFAGFLIGVGGCASHPSTVYTKQGAPLAAYEADRSACRDAGKQAMKGVGNKSTAPGTYTNSDPKYGAAPAIAADATASAVSGFEKGRAQGQAYTAALNDCMAQRGYKRVELTEAEQKTYDSLSAEEQKAQMARWVAGEETTGSGR